MRPVRISLKQILLFSLLTVLLFLVFCYAISPHVPYSRCFQHDESKLKARIEMYARTALRSIEDYKSYLGNRGPVFNNPDAKKLCVSIASVRRERVKYLEQTVATLLTRTPLSFQDRIQMTLYNLDVPASKHTVAKSLSPLIRVEDASYLSVDPDAGEITSQNVKTKEMLDYITLLTAEEKRGCDHYLVLEDDVLASKNWAKTVLDITKEVEKYGENYSMVKLFTVARYNHGKWDWKKPSDIFLIAIVTLALAAAIYGSMLGVARLINRFKPTDGYDELKNPTSSKIWGHFSRFNLISALFLSACCLSFVLYIDRKTVIGPPKGISVTDIGAQYPANLYSKDALSRWNKFFRRVYEEAKLAKTPLKPKDCYGEAFKAGETVNGKNFVHMMHHPSVFQHTGIQSSIGNNRSFKTATLSYTFPDDDAPIDFDQKFIEL